MMNNKMKSAIEKITINAATFNGDEIEPTFINFIYGRNGAGKSTIARTIASDSGVQWKEGKSSNDYDVLIYNLDFVNDNFQNYGNLPGVFTVYEKNIKIQNLVDEKIIERTKLEEIVSKANEEKGKKEKQQTSLMDTFQNTSWEKTRKIRETFDQIMMGFKQKKKFAETVLSVKTPIEHDLDALKKLYNIAYDSSSRTYNLFMKVDKINECLNGKELMAKVITSSNDTPFANFIKALNAVDWVRQGYENFTQTAEGKCPYCQNDLPDKFETDIAACFDAQYQKDIKELEDYKILYIREMNGLLTKLNANLSDVIPSIDLSKYKDKLNLLESSIEVNKQRMDKKIKEPSSIVALEDTESFLREINILIDDINLQIKSNNDVVNAKQQKKAECKTQVWEQIAFMLDCEIESLKTSQKNLNKDITDLKTTVGTSQQEAKKISNEISELNKKIVNTKATIDSMNILLRNSGFQGFSLREKSGVQNVYEVIREDGSVATNLSEGERNFIAFLYFYHRVRGSHSSNEVKDKIVVIDDPVSSMDSSALFIVSALVREMIEICYNNTDYLGQKVQGDYIKQIFVLTHNVYFHREITYQQVSRYRSASFYIIHKTDNVSSIKLCSRQCPNIPTEKANYNPVQNSYAALWDEFKELKSPIPTLNVIRQILEYYFLQLCGYDGADLRKSILEENKEKFIVSVEGRNADMEKYHLASSMLTYISNPHGLSDGLNYVEDFNDIEQYKSVFKLIFETLNQEQHYNMMMGEVK